MQTTTRINNKEITFSWGDQKILPSYVEFQVNPWVMGL